MKDQNQNIGKDNVDETMFMVQKLLANAAEKINSLVTSIEETIMQCNMKFTIL